MVSTSAGLKNKEKSMSGISTIGAHRMVASVVLLQYPQALLQSSLKYCQVAARVAHQVVTMITELAAKVAIMV
jgi:hypothetical protein